MTTMTGKDGLKTMASYRHQRKKLPFAVVILAVLFLLSRPSDITKYFDIPFMSKQASVSAPGGFSYKDIPAWDKKHPYVTVNDNTPYFKASSLKRAKSYEKYAQLDSLGRATRATACIGTDLMPEKSRGYIGNVKPTGWHTVKYNGIDGNYLYNRCHLIGYQLTGENANEQNLITGTRYLNIDGMLDFENEVADYLHKNPKNHVLYRVTPIYKDDDLLCRGVLMEGYSIEDHGSGVKFCTFAYNVQPSVTIRYSDGVSEGPAFTGSGR